MTITNTTPGFRLAVKNPARAWSSHPTISHLIYEVKRATPTQVIAGNMHDATREIMAQHENEVATYQR